VRGGEGGRVWEWDFETLDNNHYKRERDSSIFTHSLTLVVFDLEYDVVLGGELEEVCDGREGEEYLVSGE